MLNVAPPDNGGAKRGREASPKGHAPAGTRWYIALNEEWKWTLAA